MFSYYKDLLNRITENLKATRGANVKDRLLDVQLDLYQFISSPKSIPQGIRQEYIDVKKMLTSKGAIKDALSGKDIGAIENSIDSMNNEEASRAIQALYTLNEKMLDFQ